MAVYTGIGVVLVIAGMALSMPNLAVVGSLTSMTLLMLYIIVVSQLDKNQLVIRAVAWITGSLPVVVMDFTGQERLTLVRAQENGSWAGPLNPNFRLGHLILCANGFVDPHCESHFCYIWRPLDRNLETQLALSHSDTWPSWQVWKSMSHMDMIEARRQVFA